MVKFEIVLFSALKHKNQNQRRRFISVYLFTVSQINEGKKKSFTVISQKPAARSLNRIPAQGYLCMISPPSKRSGCFIFCFMSQSPGLYLSCWIWHVYGGPCVMPLFGRCTFKRPQNLFRVVDDDDSRIVSSGMDPWM